MSQIQMDGKVVVVTGGGSGIGAAVVDRMRGAGAQVVVGDLVPPSGLDRVVGVTCDVTSESDVAELVRRALDIGPIDAVVTCAGVTSKRRIEDMDLDEWHRILEVNLTGTMLLIKHAVPSMRDHGGGSVVTIASVAAFRTSSPFNSAYAASKGAIVAMVKALVHELSPQGIRINSIAPGVIESPMTSGFGQDWLAARTGTTPLGRLGRADEVADVALFLASGMSSYVTGQLIVADGGSTSVVMTPPSS